MDKRQRLLRDAALISVLLLAGSLLYLAFPRNITTEAQQANVAAAIQDEAVSQEERPQLRIEILSEGEGEPAVHGDTLFLHYVGRLPDETVFDVNLGGDEPFAVTLGDGNVIPGWEIGLLGMKQGEERRLTIPPALAYGESGFGDVIPPHATLTFDIQLVSIKRAL